MKKYFKAEQERRQLNKAIQALEGIMQQNQQKKTFTVDGLVQKLVVAYCDQTTAFWQYFTAAHIARGCGRLDALPQYQQHMEEQLQHLQKVATRIQQLGGKIVFDLNEISMIGHNWQRINTSDVKRQLQILIRAQKQARQFYQSIIYYANALQDWTTSNLFKDLLKDQTQHQFDLKRNLEQLN